MTTNRVTWTVHDDADAAARRLTRETVGTICLALASADMSPADMDEALRYAPGTTNTLIANLLSGEGDMDLRTLAAIIHATGHRVRFAARREPTSDNG